LGNPGRVGIGLDGELALLDLGQALNTVALQIPHEFQQSMSSESTPVLSRAIVHFEMFMTELESLGEQHRVLRPWTEIALRWAKKYYIRMDDTDVYVVSMCKSLVYHCSAAN
jgi:hypothetical protein